jgi:xanthine dehydrogenase accessory factor
MRDVAEDIARWQDENKSVALATVVQTWGSSPRQAGAKMAMTPAGEIVGSVSGGCVEGAVYEAGVEALQQRQPRLLHFGVADETAWEVGLACGGSIDVFVQPLEPGFFGAVRSALDTGRALAIATVVGAPADGGNAALGQTLVVDETGVLWRSAEGAAADLEHAARLALEAGKSGRVALGDEAEAFVEVIMPPPTLVVVGGVHITIALTQIAKTLGYRTVVVDPRQAFGSEARFPHVDQLIQEWPDEALGQVALNRSTAIALLTHDPKLDDPGLKVALASPAFYIGALGSRNTQAKRRQRLLDDGVTQAQLDRLHGPIGLPLNSRTPEEIALSIMAEIVAVKNHAEAITARDAQSVR